MNSRKTQCTARAAGVDFGQAVLIGPVVVGLILSRGRAEVDPIICYACTCFGVTRGDASTRNHSARSLVRACGLA